MVLGGTGSVAGSPGCYKEVLGRYMSVLVDTWWYWVSIEWYWFSMGLFVLGGPPMVVLDIVAKGVKISTDQFSPPKK